MRATQSDHDRLVMNSKTVLNTAKRTGKIIDYKIQDIHVGEIKVSMTTARNQEESVQLRSGYDFFTIEQAIKSKIKQAVSEVSRVEKRELAVATA